MDKYNNETFLPNLEKASRLVKKSTSNCTKDEARFLVETYYQIQGYRIASCNQARSLEGNPNDFIKYIIFNTLLLEKNIKSALEQYVKNNKIGNWMLSITGIGPVIAAGILAHIDINQAPTAGHIMAFAGLDPTKKWEKGQVRPWNAKLKTLMWKLGESFIKVQNRENDIYGKIYAIRKQYENNKNENLEYKDQADEKLNYVSKQTEAYKYYSKGMLPPGHIHARARRYTCKIFISHLHHAWYLYEFKKDPPLPYNFAILNHAHIIVPPNLELVK